ncbi:MAG: GxxExxY protein [Desulfosoma sp.]
MDRRREHLNRISERVIGAAIWVHRELGPGLLESVYERCLEMELRASGLAVEVQVPVPVVYRGEEISECGFRLDLLVEGLVVVELKSVEQVQPVHKKQLLTYLKLARKPLGLLINFNEVMLKDGITRIVWDLSQSTRR